MIDRVLESKEVHSFSEYHDSLEQDHSKIAKSYADFAIRHYGSSSAAVVDGYEEESRIREEGTIFIQLSTSLMTTYLSCKMEGFLSRETEPNERYVMN